MTADPVVSTGWLAQRLGDAGVQVLDATWFMPGDPRTGGGEYAKAHIPGAVFFDIDAMADKTSDLPHMLPAPEVFAAAAGELGLRRDAEVVVYDAQGIFSAPRVWWTLRTMGFPNVHVLDGGLKAWRDEGRPLESSPPARQSTIVETCFQPGNVRDIGAIRRHLASGDSQVVDARAGQRFRGEAPEPRPGLPSGHMPGARNVAWNEVIGEDGRLKPAQALRAVFEAAGVDLARPIVATCGTGVTAAVLALALARMGRDDVAIYDGSWTEWASRSDTEIVTGPA